MAIGRFMASPIGRWGRIVVGVALIAVGLLVVGGTAGWVMAAVGLLPLTLGLTNGCLLAPLLRVPFRGADLPKQ